MEANENSPFIFYLTLDETLPKDFFIFDRHFKNLGFLLIPVKIDQFQTLLTSTEQSSVVVISSVRDSRELRIYNEKIRSLMKFVLKSKTLTFIQLSSFSSLDDTKAYILSKNYYFMKYPVDAAILTSKIVDFYEFKSEQNIKWPGGKRAGVGSMSV